MLRCDRDRGLAHERCAAGEHLEQDARGRIEVRARIDCGSACLLGREVLGGTQDCLGLRECGLCVFDRACDAEVHDLDPAVRGDLHIGRFDVSVHDARAVAEGQGIEDAEHVLDGLLGIDALAVDQFPQCLTGDVLHHDVGAGHTIRALGFDLTGVIDRHDRVMVERSHSLGLALEPLVERVVRGEFWPQYLDGDTTPQTDVLTQVHGGHTTATDDLTDLVPVVDQVGHCGHRHTGSPLGSGAATGTLRAVIDILLTLGGIRARSLGHALQLAVGG